MLRRDLEATGIPYRDEADRVADLHSLRHTYISNLGQSGASPKVSQSLARHSTISLTLDRYTHISTHSERRAIENLPVLPGVDTGDGPVEKVAAVRTGTDDLPAETPGSAYKKLAKKSDFCCPSQSSTGAGKEQMSEQKGLSLASSKSLSAACLGADRDKQSPRDNRLR